MMLTFKNIKKISATLLFFLALFIILTTTAYAQGGTICGSPICLPNPFRGGSSLFALLRSVINDIVLPIGGILAVLSFIYSGFLYVTAQGDETKIKTAHKALLGTTVGTAVLLGSWVLANVICQTIGGLGGPICPTP